LTDYVDYGELVSENTFVSLLAYLLFNDMALFTLVAALLMFVGIIGAISLTIKDTTSTNIIAIRSTIRETITKKY